MGLPMNEELPPEDDEGRIVWWRRAGKSAPRIPRRKSIPESHLNLDFSLGILRVRARFALLAERLQDLSPRAFRELSVISRSATLRGSRSVAEVVGGYSSASANTALAEATLERKLRGVQKKPEGGVSATAVKASANHHHCC